MFVRVRTVDGKQNVTVTVSKSTTVGQFKAIIESKLNIKTEKQRLFFRGKQLEDVHKINDYGININDVVQLMIKPDEEIIEKRQSLEKIQSNSIVTIKGKTNCIISSKEELTPCDSKYFRVGDHVDAKDYSYGAWFEGVIVGIYKNTTAKDVEPTSEDDSLYEVAFDSVVTESPQLVTLQDVRPRSRTVLPASCLSAGQTVLANYNVEEPASRGYWYDLTVSTVRGRLPSMVRGSLYVGRESVLLEDVTLAFTDEIMKIEKRKLLSERSGEELQLMQRDTLDKRKCAPYCLHCSDEPELMCKECGCSVCAEKKDAEKQIVCDECNMAFHIYCLEPPLDKVPDGEDWYCSDCKNDESEIVQAGELLKVSKKKARLPSSFPKKGKEWGQGMACVGRTTECTIVPPNHFGPIPGIEVGASWKFRVQVSEVGVHRPSVAGIHGRENEGAYSLVLSGGYEDDEDLGEEFYYTGSGGRDLSGNRRTAGQSSDQLLTRMNRALALNCNAPLNAEKGAEAEEWREGRPVRVVRNFKLGRHSKYAPLDGNRYDGIYKVLKYFPEKGKSGFIVWRYLLRRDDPTPAPWTPEGQSRVRALGLQIQYPEGYLEAKGIKRKENIPESRKKPKKRMFKIGGFQSGEVKRCKVEVYQLEEGVEASIASDTANKKLWDSVKIFLPLGKKGFLDKVVDAFLCVCCQELVYRPVTTPCRHNICLMCLKRSFEAEVLTCPCCRASMDQMLDLEQHLNSHLQSALLILFPGYSAAR